MAPILMHKESHKYSSDLHAHANPPRDQLASPSMASLTHSVVLAHELEDRDVVVLRELVLSTVLINTFI